MESSGAVGAGGLVGGGCVRARGTVCAGRGFFGAGVFSWLAADADKTTSDQECGVVLIEACGTVFAHRLAGKVLVFTWPAPMAGGGGRGRLEKADRARLARGGAVGGLVGPGRAGCAGTTVDARVASVARVTDASVGANMAVAVGRAGCADRVLMTGRSVVGVVEGPRYERARVAGVAAGGGDVVVVDDVDFGGSHYGMCCAYVIELSGK